MTATKTTKPAAKTTAKAPAKPARAPKTGTVTDILKSASKAGAKVSDSAFGAMVAQALTTKAPKVAEPKAPKPARQPAAAKAAPKAPVQKAAPAEKLAKATEAFVARVAQPGTVLHVIAEGSRPVAGARLAAHTHAALNVLGMMNDTRESASYRDALSVMGAKAVRFHLKEHNFELHGESMLRLTAVGLSKFKSRVIDMALANRFVSMFIDGTVDSALGVNAGHVYPLARV